MDTSTEVKKISAKKTWIIALLAAIILLLLVYVISSRRNNSFDTQNNTATTTPTSTPSITPTITVSPTIAATSSVKTTPTIAVAGSCTSGYKKYTNEYFSVCIPQNMELESAESVANPTLNGRTTITATFTSSDDVLTVISDFQGGWTENSPCVVKEEIKVANLNATRRSYKTEANGSCLTNFQNFETYIDQPAIGDQANPGYIINLMKKDTSQTYSDITLYKPIEQSLKITK
jgi:hypothetical protein